MAEKNRSNEIHITRIYDAPVKMVWEAWVDPDQVAQWWGPRGFTLTTKSKDVRTGGTWIYTMHGPDGVDYPNSTFFHQVEQYSRLVYDHGASEGKPPLFRVDVQFSENNGKTKMDMRMILENPAAAEATRKFIKQAGGNSTWDRLAEYLIERLTKKDVFVVNRSFEVPLVKMFELWTSPEHFSKWLPPTGFTMEFIRADIRVGGSSFYCMTGEAGIKLHGRVEYLKITKPNKIVYTQEFCDENEKISRHPMSPTWPQTMLTTVSLNAENDKCTRVTVKWEVAGDATETERRTFHEAKTGMTQGWSGSFDKLEQYVLSLS